MSDAEQATADQSERAIDFVKVLLTRYTSYHDQKEGMAWAGFALFAAAAGAGLLSKSWPPQWGTRTTILALGAVTLFWLGALGYLRFQLRRRRWAALRVAGCERVLAGWVLDSPTKADLVPAAPAHAPMSRWLLLVDLFWPRKGAVAAVHRGKQHKPPEPFYPQCLVKAWISQETAGTEAVIHEYLLAAATWVLYGALLLRTLAERSA